MDEAPRSSKESEFIDHSHVSTDVVSFPPVFHLEGPRTDPHITFPTNQLVSCLTVAGAPLAG